MTTEPKCEWCGDPIPPGRRRRYCEDRCRKRADRARPKNLAEVPLVEGPVTEAVRLLVAEVGGSGGVDGARSELAIAAAKAVDGGSVPAMAQLRAVLDELAGIEDDEVAAFRASVQTPRVMPRPAPE